MSKVSARCVPKLLWPVLKRTRLNMSKENIVIFYADPNTILQWFVTMGEARVHHFQPKTKQQSKQWKHLGSLPPMEANTGMSAGKVMISIFWDTEGVLLVDYLDKGHTNTGAYYADLLRQLREKISQFVVERGVFLHQDNTPSQTSTVDSKLSNTHSILLIWIPLNTIFCRKWKRSLVVIILSYMMLLMLWTTFWGTKMVPSTQKGFIYSMTSGVSVLM